MRTAKLNSAGDASPGRSDRGFTLIELLVVVAVILVLLGLLLPAIGLVRNAVRRSQTRSLVDAVTAALNTYQLEDGRRRFPWAYDDRSLRTTGAGSADPDVLDLLSDRGLDIHGDSLAPAPPLSVGAMRIPSAKADRMLIDGWKRQICYTTDIVDAGTLVVGFTAPGGAPTDWNPQRQRPYGYVWSVGKPVGDFAADAQDANVGNWIYHGSR